MDRCPRHRRWRYLAGCDPARRRRLRRAHRRLVGAGCCLEVGQARGAAGAAVEQGRLHRPAGRHAAADLLDRPAGDRSAQTTASGGQAADPRAARADARRSRTQAAERGSCAPGERAQLLQVSRTARRRRGECPHRPRAVPLRRRSRRCRHLQRAKRPRLSCPHLARAGRTADLFGAGIPSAACGRGAAAVLGQLRPIRQHVGARRRAGCAQRAHAPRRTLHARPRRSAPQPAAGARARRRQSPPGLRTPDPHGDRAAEGCVSAARRPGLPTPSARRRRGQRHPYVSPAASTPGAGRRHRRCTTRSSSCC